VKLIICLWFKWSYAEDIGSGAKLCWLHRTQRPLIAFQVLYQLTHVLSQCTV